VGEALMKDDALPPPHTIPPSEEFKNYTGFELGGLTVLYYAGRATKYALWVVSYDNHEFLTTTRKLNQVKNHLKNRTELSQADYEDIFFHKSFAHRSASKQA